MLKISTKFHYRKALIFLGIYLFALSATLAQKLEDIKVFYEPARKGEYVFYSVNSIANNTHMVVVFDDDMSDWRADAPLPFQTTIRAGKVKLFKLKGSVDTLPNFQFKTHFFPGVGNPTINTVEYTIPGEDGQEVIFKGVTDLNEEEGGNLISYYGAGFYCTYIRVMRSGTVVEVKESIGKPEDSFIKIAHRDGTIGTYTGILRGTMKAFANQYIDVGQILGVAGLRDENKTFFEFSVSYMKVEVDNEKEPEAWASTEYLKPLFRTAKKKKAVLKPNIAYIAAYPDIIHTQEMTKAEKKKFIQSKE